MRFVYSRHALLRMRQRRITGQMVEQVLTAPGSIVEGETADAYTAFLDGVFVRVILAHGREPRVVVTVFPVNHRIR